VVTHDVGARVTRGKDWWGGRCPPERASERASERALRRKWKDQDGGAGKLGTVVATKDGGTGADGWTRVKWDAGGEVGPLPLARSPNRVSARPAELVPHREGVFVRPQVCQTRGTRPRQRARTRREPSSLGLTADAAPLRAQRVKGEPVRTVDLGASVSRGGSWWGRSAPAASQRDRSCRSRCRTYGDVDGGPGREGKIVSASGVLAVVKWANGKEVGASPPPAPRHATRMRPVPSR
jgi:hypothetical protein